MITEKELDDYLISQSWTRNDLTEEQLSSLRHDIEWEKMEVPFLTASYFSTMTFSY